MKKMYAITTPEGLFISLPNETGSGDYITLETKEKAYTHLKMYYPVGYKLKMLKVK